MSESNRTTTAPASDEPSLVDATLAVKDAVVVLGGSLAQTLAIADRTLLTAAREHPYLLLGGAAGAGFVAGGGLAAPLTRSLMRFGFKTASAFVLDAAMRAVAPMMSSTPTMEPSDPSRDPSRDPSSPPVPPGIDIDAASATSAAVATTSTAEAQRRETSSSVASSAHHVAHP